MIHVLYHGGGCHDGFGAAWAAWTTFGEDAVYIPVVYGQDPPEMPLGSEVYIVDFSYKRAVLEKMAAKYPQVTVLDHHKTAMEDLRGFPGAVFDLGRSGALLAWEYFRPESRAPLFVQYLSDHDLWKHELPQSKEIHAWLSSVPMTWKDWSRARFRMEEEWRAITEIGAAVLMHEGRQVEEMAKRARPITILGKNVLAANCTAFYSEVGNRICLDHPELPFAAYYFDRKDGKRQWGLRSTGGFDCSLVAQAFGGGGHPGAAGFETALDWFGDK